MEPLGILNGSKRKERRTKNKENNPREKILLCIPTSEDVPWRESKSHFLQPSTVFHLFLRPQHYQHQKLSIRPEPLFFFSGRSRVHEYVKQPEAASDYLSKQIKSTQNSFLNSYYFVVLLKDGKEGFPVEFPPYRPASYVSYRLSAFQAIYAYG